MPKRTHSKLPADYMPLLVMATLISIAAALISSIELLTIATWISAAVGLYLFVRDTVQMLGGVGFIGRLVVNFGIFYWFWLGAWQASAHDPPFVFPVCCIRVLAGRCRRM